MRIYIIKDSSYRSHNREIIDKFAKKIKEGESKLAIVSDVS
jgi:hypothetical protein